MKNPRVILIARSSARPIVRRTLLSFASVLVFLIAPPGARAASADAPAGGAPSVTAEAPEPSVAPHANPRLTLSYRRFAIANLDMTSVPLRGLELDTYFLSTRWLRAGFEFEGGSGEAALGGRTVGVKYGLAGLTAGIQYPARITPFVEGRLLGGVLAGNVDQPITIPGTSLAIAGTSAATWITGRGVDLGIELYVVSRVYVSAAVGWLRTTWRGIDYPAMMQNPSSLVLEDLTSDGYTFRLGLGF